ncbi:NAD(P)-binding protein [Cutaneotrichosporon oleaginosum]|uniref:NAD(P)-binding protein n=1 Tax=Cutaneotrichosporon oleaginosum TaxID=879819 RepID=A0A0J1ATC0_9TREE|nr:NAD(P)-binding protein [Cutaneotrichosporon oleaginosum]KLT38564.1 NAD(P)-binding protein [Cutaneotrichosporon oleaginosum]TXT08485.1 hypothetical protein COLE_05409 [Cutaneotrichosporon oleaginosum]
MTSMQRSLSTPAPPDAPPIPFSRPVTPSLRGKRWAFLGLGEMGKRMATNLARTLTTHNCPPLIVWNRNPDRVEAFKSWASEREVHDSTFVVMKDLKDIVKEADVVVTSLKDDAAVKEVYAVLFAAESQRDTTYVDMSTTYPTLAGELERRASSKTGRSFIACPVFGVPRAAERADLVLAIAGDYYAKKVVAHTLCPGIGKKVMDMGANVERALSFKLVGNALELGFVELMSEAFTLCEAAGAGSAQLVELIREQHGSASLLRYAERIRNNKFDATGGFTVAGGLADAKHIRQLADTHNVPMPTIDVAHQHLTTARAVGGEDYDWTALVAGERIASGQPPFAGKTRLERYEGP